MIRLCCLALAMFALSVPAAAEPTTGRLYYSIQVASAGAAPPLEQFLQSLGDFPYKRIEQRGSQYTLRVGFWAQPGDADTALRDIRRRFPAVFLRTAYYRPEAMLQAGARAPASRAGDGTVTVINQAQQNVITPEELEAARNTDKSNTGVQGEQGTSPDETALWSLLHQNRLGELRDEIARMKRTYPGWTPSGNLQKWQRNAEADARVAEAIKGNDSDDIIALSATHPDEAGCRNIPYFWALAQAYAAKGREKEAMDTYAGLLYRCNDAKTRAATLYKAVDTLDEDDARTFLVAAQHASDDPEYRSTWSDVDYSLLKRLYAAQKTKNNRPQVEALFLDLEPKVLQREDAAQATLFGWDAYERNELPAAETWFGRALQWQAGDEARYGLALTRFKMGELDEAEAGITDAAMQNDARFLLLRRNIDFARAQRAYDQKHFSESLAVLDRHPEAASERDVVMLRAWNQLGLGHKDAAADLFLAAYRQQADTVSADGLVLASADDPARLARLPEGNDALLRSRIDAAEFQKYYDRKLFMAAHEFSPDEHPALSGIDAFNIALAAGTRHKSGASGTSQLEVSEFPIAEAATVIGQGHEFRVDLADVDLSSGALAPGAQVGSAQTGRPYVASPTTHVSGALSPSLFYRHQGETTIYAEAGLTPDGGLPGMPVGELGVLRQLNRAQVQARIYSQPVRESILSYTGIVDPYTGVAWGRVRDTGIAGEGLLFASDAWTFSGGIRVDDLSGRDVLDNDSVTLNAGVARNLRYAGFDYFTVGPDTTYQAFNRNLSGFTLGQGGYYSPQRLNTLGASVHFLTNEARAFIIKGDLSAGFFSEQDDASPCVSYPATSAGCLPREPATNHSGIYYSAELAGAYQVSKNILLGAGVISRQTPQYTDFGATVFLRYFFEPRAAVFSSDLSLQFMRQLY